MRKLLLLILFIILMGFTSSVRDDIVIYPNPAKDYFYIESKINYLPPYVKIYNLYGNLVYTEYIGELVMVKRIDIKLKSGTYIVFLTIKE